MGWATKKKRSWEMKQLMGTFASIILFLPLPVHIFPFVMMSQASKGKVRSWYALAWFLLMVELALFGSFLFFVGAASTGLWLTLGGMTLSYIVGNGLLLNQAKSYLQRLELHEVRPLIWIGSIEKQRRLELAQASMETPHSFVTKMLHYRKEINNNNIHQHIDKIIRLFQLLENKDMMEAERFLVRHGTVINVLRQYDELENTRLHNQMAIDSKMKLESVLAQAALAIEQDVSNMIKSSLLDVSAESDVYIQTLKNRNLLKE